MSDTLVLAPEALDPADLDIRTSAIVRCPWADTLDIRFAASHDGIVRRRADRTPIIGPATTSPSLQAVLGWTRDGETIARHHSVRRAACRT